MNADTALEAYAAISVGVAGFSAIVVALAANTVLYDGRRLNRIGLNMKGRVYDTPTKRSREVSIAKYVYILTAIVLILAGIWHPIPGYYLVGMTIMLTLSLWVLLIVFFVIGFSKKRGRD